MGSLVGLVGSWFIGCQVLLCVEADGHWLAGSALKVADCINSRGPRATAGLLVGGVRVQETLGLLPAHWWLKPHPGASAGLLAGRAKPWVLVAGPRGPRAGVESLVGGGARFLTQLGMGPRVS